MRVPLRESEEDRRQTGGRILCSVSWEEGVQEAASSREQTSVDRKTDSRVHWVRERGTQSEGARGVSCQFMSLAKRSKRERERERHTRAVRRRERKTLEPLLSRRGMEEDGGATAKREGKEERKWNK